MEPKDLSPLIVFQWFSKLDNIGIDHAVNMLLEVKKEDWPQYANVRFVMRCILNNTD